MSYDIGSSTNVVELEDAGIRISLLDAAGDPLTAGGTPVTALVAGVYSKRASGAKSRLLEKNLKRGARQTAESVEAGQLRLDAALVIEWDLTMNGEMASAETVFAMWPHIRDQITEAANDHARFIRTASSAQ